MKKEGKISKLFSNKNGQLGLKVSDEMSKMKLFVLWLYVYKSKARNPGNIVAATNPVFDLLMTSKDLK